VRIVTDVNALYDSPSSVAARECIAFDVAPFPFRARHTRLGFGGAIARRKRCRGKHRERQDESATLRTWDGHDALQ
jgi:hypothetical protein